MTVDQFNAALREIDPILEEINRAMSNCVQAGVEPRELWLGPDEQKRLWDYLRKMEGPGKEWFDFNYGPEGPATIPPITFQGMAVIPMLPPEVRVGSSFTR